MKRVACLGMPNSGKSTLFNRITGKSAHIGNWPGVTVSLLNAKIIIGAQLVELVDLPGIYDLQAPTSDEERLVTRFLDTHTPDLVILVINTPQIAQQLPLIAQLQARNIPALLALNMADEAVQHGIQVNTTLLAEQLQIPVVMVSAKYGQGCPLLMQEINQLLTRPAGFTQHPLPDLPSLLKNTVIMPAQLNHLWTNRLDHVLLHPLWGLPIFFASIYLIFHLIFTLGKPMQDAITSTLGSFSTHHLAGLLVSLPHWVQGLLLNGVYAGLSTIAAFVPIIILFFLVMTFVENSGYLARAAFLIDSFMVRLGLDGRSFVMILMGFGCNVPALMGTRIMGSRNLRLLTMLVIPFSLCSARLQVFLFLTTALFTVRLAPVILFSLYMTSFVVTFASAWLFRKKYQDVDPFIFELPPYRLPTWRQVIFRGWQEVLHFLQRASKLILLGVIAIWALTSFPGQAAIGQTYAAMISQWMRPVLAPLGIDDHLAIALIFGFIAKEIVIGALAIVYGTQGDALLHLIPHSINWIQGMSFMLFTLIYTPCISTTITLKNESRSLTFTGLSILWSLLLAWCVSFVFYQTASLIVRL